MHLWSRDSLKGIRGTTLHYFKEENTKVPTVALTFESGQHDEPLSINRAIAAVTNCMRIIGSVRVEDVENRHDKLLMNIQRIYQRYRNYCVDMILHQKLNSKCDRISKTFKGYQRGKLSQMISTARLMSKRTVY